MPEVLEYSGETISISRCGKDPISAEYNRPVPSATTPSVTASTPASPQPRKLVTISSGISAPTRMAILLPLALIFALATVTYSAIWMYYIRLQPQVELGLSPQPGPSGSDIEVIEVWK